MLRSSGEKAREFSEDPPILRTRIGKGLQEGLLCMQREITGILSGESMKATGEDPMIRDISPSEEALRLRPEIHEIPTGRKWIKPW